MSLNEYTDLQLQQELNRRSRNQWIKRVPQILPEEETKDRLYEYLHLFVEDVREVILKQIDVDHNCRSEDAYAMYIEVLTIFFGEDLWEWYEDNFVKQEG